MTTCCPGNPLIPLTWTPCGEATEQTVTGWSGAIASERTENCAISQSVWTTPWWTSDDIPNLGAVVDVSGVDWFVDKVTKAGCAVVLRLCRPVLECPDCEAKVYRLSRSGASPEVCAEELAEGLVDQANAKICTRDERRQLVNNAEIIRTVARICLETSADIQPGDFVYCAPSTWRVESITSPCSAKCLLTIEAILEPWSLHVEPEE